MRVRRLHTSQKLEPGCEVRLEEAAAHYLGRVLRVRPGQSVALFNGDGCEYPARVLRVDKKQVELCVTGRADGQPESPLRITLAQGINRGERMDQTLQKCTELGVAGFQPLISERVETRFDSEKMARRLGHWRSVVISACEQSGRCTVPTVSEPLELVEWLAREAGSTRIALAPDASRALVDTHCADRVEIAIGPEGGFSTAELERMQSQGVSLARLGPRVLRTETAGPAAVAVMQAVAGDLGGVERSFSRPVG
ncbi:MAG: 16S rRNA (uracil(1498)-N(3))-methyltransferase [Xanthomonadales bacterium]|nr:16S rRNA (uracil(1498)-N(3))-methyltransferase [Xanthomonadales bacterium]